MSKRYIILILLLLGVGCISESPPEKVIDEQTYKQMFMEFAIIDQLDQQILDKRSKDDYRQLVYEHYDVTEEEFKISHEYYEQQVEQQLERVEEMTRTLRLERDSLNNINTEYRKLSTPEQVDSLRQVLGIKE